MDWKSVFGDMVLDLNQWEDAASDLWTWLPAHYVARQFFGSQGVSEIMPGYGALMIMSTEVMRIMKVKPDDEGKREFFLAPVEIDELMMWDEISAALCDLGQLGSHSREVALGHLKWWFENTYGVRLRENL